MFRSLLFTFVTLAFLSGAFFLYWHLQPAVVSQGAPKKQTAATATTAPNDDTEMSIGPGRRGWANSFDNSGHLSSQFTAAEFTPQKDGTFKVVRPVNVFYLNDGQYMVVTGENGLVYVDSAAGSSGKASPMQAGMQSPNRGLLQQVHIALYPSKTSEHEILWMDVNNLSFDNDTLRLYTQSYQDANGATVPADQVPVKVRGDDYEFDGTGLTIRWNGRDRHLHLLEIAHGGRLEIKNPSKMSMPLSEHPQARLGDAPLPEALASSSPVPISVALPSTSVAPTTSPSAIAYRAVFNEAVRVLQGELPVARADTMTVDFLPAPEKPAAPTTSPASAPALVKVESEQKAPTAAQKLADREPGAAATQPAGNELMGKTTATQPINPPITIYWIGKLRITPLDSDPVMPITAGQSAIRLVGSPVILTPKGSNIRASAVTYRNPDGAVQLESSPAQPLIDVKQDRGMTFTAESVNYDPSKAMAIITGKSNLRLPLEEKHEQLTASWTDRGVLHFTGKAMQPDSVDHVDLFGNVKVDHPQFTLNSNELALGLEKGAIIPPATKPALTLKRATATGAVQCRLLRPNQPSQEIDSDDLILGTVPGPDGKMSPRTVIADGHVKAVTADQELHAGHLEALLRPQVKPVVKKTPGAATAPTNELAAVELESLDATSNVHSIMKGGTTADADSMHVTTHVMIKDEKQQVQTQVQLIGQPAKISDGTGRSLSAPVVQISPELGTMNAQGAGTIHTLGLTEDGKPGGPVVVTWAKSLALDSKANTADVIGSVLVTTTDNDGAINTVAGDTAHLDLMDAAPAKEARDTKEKRETKKASATQPGSEFGNKGLKALTLSGNVVMHSLLNAADGTVAAEKLLKSSKLIYNNEAFHAELPGPGSLFMRDNRTNTKPDKANKTDVGQGNMAMTWQTGLVYDHTRRTIVVQGKVVSGFKKPTDTSPVNLKAEVVTIDLARSSTTAPAADSALGSMQISHFRAENEVELRGEKPSENGKPSKVYTADCNRLDYDPATDLVTLRGKDDQAPGEFLSDQETSPLTFLVMVFNIKTQQIVSSEGGRGTLRK